MLSKKQRFSTSDFTLIKTLKPQKVFMDIGVFCIYKKSNEKVVSKFGVIVPKKIFKTAVLRNKYKRLFFNTLSDQPASILFYPKKFFTKMELNLELNKII